jgi:hypothetical protein
VSPASSRQRRELVAVSANSPKYRPLGDTTR